jgi:hypothetical protein
MELWSRQGKNNIIQFFREIETFGPLFSVTSVVIKQSEFKNKILGKSCITADFHLLCQQITTLHWPNKLSKCCRLKNWQPFTAIGITWPIKTCSS